MNYSSNYNHFTGKKGNNKKHKRKKKVKQKHQHKNKYAKQK